MPSLPLLVEQHATEQSKRVLGEEGVCFGVAREGGLDSGHRLAAYVPISEDRLVVVP